ncbi:hypothetical protein [Streptomyces cadmiisoli]|uniref:hypothetical protein n=1 Tax=Streptomyces cadmiisoli TaxID=2184053 RepID=UPI003D717A23
MFAELLSFRLLPRLSCIGSIRQSFADDTPLGWPLLGASLSRAIRWALIAEQRDQTVKYAIALRLGTAEAGRAAAFHSRWPQAPHLPGPARPRPGSARDLRLQLHRRQACAAESMATEVSRGLVACSVTVLWPAAGLRCDFRNLPLKQ